MSAFFDTNVLVYCTDALSPAKRQVALALVQKATVAGDGWLSTQVLIELFNVLTRKQRVPPAVAKAVVEAYAPWPTVSSDVPLVHNAMALSARHQLSIWDAMVVEAALLSKADVLYSEDLQAGQRFEQLLVVNPFATD